MNTVSGVKTGTSFVLVKSTLTIDTPGPGSAVDCVARQRFQHWRTAHRLVSEMHENPSEVLVVLFDAMIEFLYFSPEQEPQDVFL